MTTYHSGNSLVGPNDDGDMRHCTKCDEYWTGGGDCPVCNPEMIPCPDCRGTGCEFVGECMIDEPCPTCDGDCEVEA